MEADPELDAQEREHRAERNGGRRTLERTEADEPCLEVNSEAAQLQEVEADDYVNVWRLPRKRREVHHQQGCGWDRDRPDPQFWHDHLSRLDILGETLDFMPPRQGLQAQLPGGALGNQAVTRAGVDQEVESVGRSDGAFHDNQVALMETERKRRRMLRSRGGHRRERESQNGPSAAPIDISHG